MFIYEEIVLFFCSLSNPLKCMNALVTKLFRNRFNIFPLSVSLLHLIFQRAQSIEHHSEFKLSFVLRARKQRNWSVLCCTVYAER